MTNINWLRLEMEPYKLGLYLLGKISQYGLRSFNALYWYDSQALLHFWYQHYTNRPQGPWTVEIGLFTVPVRMEVDDLERALRAENCGLANVHEMLHALCNGMFAAEIADSVGIHLVTNRKRRDNTFAPGLDGGES